MGELVIPAVLVTAGYVLAIQTVHRVLIDDDGPEPPWPVRWGFAAILAAGTVGFFTAPTLPDRLGPLTDPTGGIAPLAMAGMMPVLWPVILLRWQLDLTILQSLGATLLIHFLAVAATLFLTAAALFTSGVAYAMASLVGFEV